MGFEMNKAIFAMLLSMIVLAGCGSPNPEESFPSEPGRYMLLSEQNGESVLLVRQIFADGSQFDDAGRVEYVGSMAKSADLAVCGKALIDGPKIGNYRKLMLLSAVRSEGCELSDLADYELVQ